MNIWWFNQHANVPDQAGHTRNYSLAYYLTKLGYKVTIVSSEFNYFALSKRTQKKDQDLFSENINGVNFLWIKEKFQGSSYWSRLLSMFYFAKQCKKLLDLKILQKPDLIIGSSPSIFAANAAYDIARKWHTPFVLEVRDIWPLAIIDLKKTKAYHPLMLYMRFIEKKIYKNASGAIYTMPDFPRYLKENYLHIQHLQYIPQGIDYALSKNADIIQQKDKFVVIHAGKFAVANHLITVVDAARILQEKYPLLPIEFWLIGEGVQKKALKEIAKNKMLTRIKFFDSLPKTEIYAFMQQADALLLHVKKADVYRYGCTTNRLPDYLSSLRPLIYAFSSNTYDPVRESGCGVSIPSEDPHALAEAAIHLYQLPLDERKKMAERGKAYVKSHHNMEILAQELSDFLQRI